MRFTQTTTRYTIWKHRVIFLRDKLGGWKDWQILTFGFSNKKYNSVVDALSRQVEEIKSDESYGDEMLENLIEESKLDVNTISMASPNSQIVEKLIKEYNSDTEFKKLWKSPKKLFTK